MRTCRRIFRNVQTSKRIENAISLDAKSVAETIPILRFNPLYTRTNLLIYGLTLVRSNSSLRRTTENLPTTVPTTLDTKQYIAAKGDNKRSHDAKWLFEIESASVVSALVPMAIRPASLVSQPYNRRHPDRRFHFFTSATASGQEGVLQRATSATVADIRRRPSISIRWMHHRRRLFSAEAIRVHRIA